MVFRSSATNLHGDDEDAEGDIYMRDLETATTSFVGRGPAGADRVSSVDHSPDSVDCGPGRDVALADKLDRLIRCERVRAGGQRRPR